MINELSIDLQVNQGQCSWAQLTEVAHIAENNNYQTLWVADHLSGEVMNAPSMPECFTLLGALAAITSTINIGPLVANVGNRHPGVLASAAATVQNISGGRLILGLGAGASPTSTFAAEQLALGIALPATMGERHAKLEHTLDVLDKIWSPPHLASHRQRSSCTADRNHADCPSYQYCPHHWSARIASTHCSCMEVELWLVTCVVARHYERIIY